VPYAIAGPVCSISTGLLASLGSRYASAPQVSYGVLSPLFSDVDKFPFFYRTIPAFTAFIEPIFSLLKYFDWRVIALVVESDLVRYSLTSEALSNFLISQNAGYSVISTLSLSSHYELEGRDLGNTVRIFIAMVGENSAADTMCASYQSGLTGKDFVWILLGDYMDDWWRTNNLQTLNCTEIEMRNAVESTLILSNSIELGTGDFSSILGQNRAEFFKEFQAHLLANTGLQFIPSQSIRVLQSYDAIWAIANALNITITQNNIPETASNDTSQFFLSSQRAQLFNEALNMNMKTLSFQGTSGRIKFTNEFNSPQDPTTIIWQLQNGLKIPVGIHRKISDEYVINFTHFGENLKWQSDTPPRGSPVRVVQYVDLYIIVIAFVLTEIGIIYAIVILIINCVYRKHKVIKASSPYINCLIIAACILAMLAIPIASFESLDMNNSIPEVGYLVLCNIRPWLISIALTMGFGGLFAKTWRVYTIFRNPWAKTRHYKDHVLLGIVGALVMIDIFLLALASWQAPLRLISVIILSQTEVFTENEFRVCLENENDFTELLIWQGLIAMYIIVLFAFGIFLVIQTSKIKAKYFQDSKYIGISIYVTSITTGIGVPILITLFYNYEHNWGFALQAALVLFCVYFILSLVFIPRFLLLRKYKKKVPTAVLLGLNPSFRVKKSRALACKESPLSTEGSLDAAISPTTPLSPGLSASSSKHLISPTSSDIIAIFL